MRPDFTTIMSFCALVDVSKVPLSQPEKFSASIENLASNAPENHDSQFVVNFCVRYVIFNLKF